MTHLEKLGWSDFFAESFRQYIQDNYAAGRVYVQQRGVYWLYTEAGEIQAEIAGSLLNRTKGGELPAVGDWVVIRPRNEEGKGIIHEILPRKSKFSRKVAGNKVEEQVVAANIDTVMLVSGLDKDFNLRRIERYFTVALNSGADSVVVLNKADVCKDLERKIKEVESVAQGVPVVCVSATQNEGLETLLPFLAPGRTVAFLGSSGVGKSTIINRLLGKEAQKVQPVRVGDNRGCHTTTHRELILMPGGGLVMDTPGMRELQLWAADEDSRTAFEDIESLSALCHYSDCQHRNEPGCAVREAIENENLSLERFDNYVKLQKEVKHLIEKQDTRVAQAKKLEVKRLTRNYNKNQRRR
jgi:ribosome biogenesis GTPase